MSGALLRAGGHGGRPKPGLGRPGAGGRLGADPELSRERSGGGCSHMGKEVTELSAVEREWGEGRAESVFTERSCEFSGKPGRVSGSDRRASAWGRRGRRRKGYLGNLVSSCQLCTY